MDKTLLVNNVFSFLNTLMYQDLQENMLEDYNLLADKFRSFYLRTYTECTAQNMEKTALDCSFLPEVYYGSDYYGILTSAIAIICEMIQNTSDDKDCETMVRILLEEFGYTFRDKTLVFTEKFKDTDCEAALQNLYSTYTTLKAREQMNLLDDVHVRRVNVRSSALIKILHCLGYECAREGILTEGTRYYYEAINKGLHPEEIIDDAVATHFAVGAKPDYVSVVNKAFVEGQSDCFMAEPGTIKIAKKFATKVLDELICANSAQKLYVTYKQKITDATTTEEIAIALNEMILYVVGQTLYLSKGQTFDNTEDCSAQVPMLAYVTQNESNPQRIFSTETKPLIFAFIEQMRGFISIYNQKADDFITCNDLLTYRCVNYMHAQLERIIRIIAVSSLLNGKTDATVEISTMAKMFQNGENTFAEVTKISTIGGYIRNMPIGACLSMWFQALNSYYATQMAIEATLSKVFCCTEADGFLFNHLANEHNKKELKLDKEKRENETLRMRLRNTEQTLKETRDMLRATDNSRSIRRAEYENALLKMRVEELETLLRKANISPDALDEDDDALITKEELAEEHLEVLRDEEEVVAEKEVLEYLNEHKIVIVAQEKSRNAIFKRYFSQQKIAGDEFKMTPEIGLNTDIVVFIVNLMSHPKYYKLKSQCAVMGIPTLHLNSVAPKRIAYEIYKRMKEQETDPS